MPAAPLLLLIAAAAALFVYRSAQAAIDPAAGGDNAPPDAGSGDGAFSLGADMAPNVAGLLDSIGVPAMSTSGTRGIRNNNPGNIRASSIPWQGKTGNDGVFEIFATASDGIRALARNLKAYQLRHGDQTIADLIKRWAPPNENNTQAYIAAVAAETGIDATANVNLNDQTTLAKITAAIIRHENGQQPYDAGLIADAVARG